jgi:hypothetical protein
MFFASLPALVLLAACGGGGGAGPQTIGGLGGVAAPAGAGSGGTGSGTGVATGGLGGVGSTATAGTNTLLNPTAAKTYNAISALQSFRYRTASNATGQYGQLYQGNAATVRNPTTTIAYDPRDAIFVVTVKDSAAGIDQTLRFQDPVHRTDFGGTTQPQWGVPDLSASGVAYLQAGGSSGTIIAAGNNQIPLDGADGASSNIATFFYQRPGTNTSHVTFAGYVRNNISFANVTPSGGAQFKETTSTLERGAFVFGDSTARDQIPTRGTASYTGAFLGTMINNPTGDDASPLSDYFQWVGGTSSVGVDFAASTLTLGLSGQVGAPFIDRNSTGGSAVPGGASFTASGTARIDVARTGGFAGTFDSASFAFPSGGETVTRAVTIAGSSIDGGFYGPNAVEVGGGFRIVGAIPDERIDILGSFTGK